MQISWRQTGGPGPTLWQPETRLEWHPKEDQTTEWTGQVMVFVCASSSKMVGAGAQQSREGLALLGVLGALVYWWCMGGWRGIKMEKCGM